jgi:hypothetical protein
MSIVADILMKGKALYTDLTDATSSWDSTTVNDEIVPANKIWFLLMGVVTRDANATLTINIHDASDQLITRLASQGAATGDCNMLSNQAGAANHHATPLLRLDAGEKLNVTCGAAQGAGAAIRFKVIEIDA